MASNLIPDLVIKHNSFTNMLFELIKSLLDASSIKYHIIEKRTKTIDSLTEKIERKEIENAETEITDITGIRIILYYQDDVDKITSILYNNFKIDEKNSVDKLSLYEANEFGYLSVHYIISLNSKRNKLPEWKSYNNLKAEIQIRTVLQHSWASISHELTYKKKYEIPKELERRLFRLAGLFELADEQFLKLRDEHNSLKETIENSTSTEVEAERINLLTLQHTFKSKNIIYETISKNAIEAGFIGGEEDIDDKFLSEIIRVAEILKLKKINDIERILSDHLESFYNFFKHLIDGNKTPWMGNKAFYNLLALLSTLNHNQLTTFFNEANDWHSNISNQVIKAANTHKGIV